MGKNVTIIVTILLYLSGCHALYAAEWKRITPNGSPDTVFINYDFVKINGKNIELTWRAIPNKDVINAMKSGIGGAADTKYIYTSDVYSCNSNTYYTNEIWVITKKEREIFRSRLPSTPHNIEENSIPELIRDYICRNPKP